MTLTNHGVQYRAVLAVHTVDAADRYIILRTLWFYLELAARLELEVRRAPSRSTSSSWPT